MSGKINSQHNEICQLNRNSQSLNKKPHLSERRIAVLEKENATLPERLSRYEQPPKDSNNSSTPPSRENFNSEVKRCTGSLRAKTDRPAGGQKGHEGSTREKSEDVDETVDHASSYCTCCGDDLSRIVPTLEYTTREIDMPVLQPIIREHFHYVRVCTCGHHNRP